MIIEFSELPDYDEFPSTGYTRYNDSKVVEIEFIKNDVNYFIKGHLIVDYNRYYHPETRETPEEDTFTIIQFTVQPISGYKVVKENEIKLTDNQLDDLRPQIEDEIQFI